MTKEERDEIEARLRLYNANELAFENKRQLSETEIQKTLDLLALEEDWKKQISSKAPIDTGGVYLTFPTGAKKWTNKRIQNKNYRT